ncbi:hypothetical protein V1511DRAFT_503616 [Dipodascopsis uninucleata]
MVPTSFQILCTSELPDYFRSFFTFDAFNPMQSRCFASLYKTDHNVVISSPTGSGKTVLFELAIIKTLIDNSSSNSKIVYIAPTKSLCNERFHDWATRFSTISLTCASLTGDTSAEEIETVRNADIIITTPEKWDSTTRRWKDYSRLMKLVKLILVDEVHILKDTRGATLEVVVTRMKEISPHTRIIALSATIPNASSIAKWITKGSGDSDEPAVLHEFGDEYRSVKLNYKVHAYQPRAANTFQLDRLYSDKLPGLLDIYFDGKPIIIFCPTRRMAVSTARQLSQSWLTAQFKRNSSVPGSKSSTFDDSILDQLAKRGIVYHHAGLSLADRTLCETLFMERKILIICCTSTLSVGINLPAHLVVIKGTSTWYDGQDQEYSESDIKQMIGRAGRPQFGNSGIAVVMTTKDNKAKYDELFENSDPVESCLHKNLIEHMNAEICLGTITSLATAKSWLKATFFFIRLQENLNHYRVSVASLSSNIDIILDRLCRHNIKVLMDDDMIELSDGGGYHPTTIGKSMAMYYMQLPTMRNIKSSRKLSTSDDVLKLISRSHEFREIKFRNGEKRFYKEISNSDLKYSLISDPKEYWDKVNLIIQFVLGHLEFPVFDGINKCTLQFQCDKSIIWQHLHRLLRCLLDCKIQVKDGISVTAVLGFSASVHAETWYDSPFMLMQLEGIGPVSMRKLIQKNIYNFKDLSRLSSWEIESYLSLSRGRGMKYITELHKIPQFAISLTKVSESINDGIIKVLCEVTVKLTNKQIQKFYRRKLLSTSFICLSGNGDLIDYRRALICQFTESKQFTVEVHVKESDLSLPMIKCCVSCDEIVGTESECSIPLDLQSNSTAFLRGVYDDSTVHSGSRFESSSENLSSCPDINEVLASNRKGYNSLQVNAEFLMIDNLSSISLSDEEASFSEQHNTVHTSAMYTPMTVNTSSEHFPNTTLPSSPDRDCYPSIDTVTPTKRDWRSMVEIEDLTKNDSDDVAYADSLGVSHNDMPIIDNIPSKISSSRSDTLRTIGSHSHSRQSKKIRSDTHLPSSIIP